MRPPTGCPELIQKIEQFQGRVKEGPMVLQAAFAALEEAYAILGKVLVYASLCHAVDSTDANPTRMQGKAYGLFGQLQMAASYLDPGAGGRRKADRGRVVGKGGSS